MPAVALALAVGWRAVALVTTGPAAALRPPGGRPAAHDVRGVFHVHSDLSHDGRAGVGEIALAAARAKLDFVFLTEHGNFGIAASGQEGYRDGVLLLSGNEAGTCDSFDPKTNECVGGHLLLLGPSSLKEPLANKKSTELARMTRELGGVALAAHPANRRMPWRGETDGLDGAEMVSFFTAFENVPWTVLIPAVAAYPLNPVHAMNQVTVDPGPDLAFFDELSRRRRVVGIAGADAHANVKLTEKLRVAFPSMYAFFAMMSTHLVLDAPLRHELAADRGALLAALSRGRAYVAWDSLADPAGFSFVAQARETVHAMGETLPPQLVTLRVTAPAVPGATTRLLRNGQVVATAEGPSLVYQTSEAGAYRCELWLPFRTVLLGSSVRHPWILSNPIYLVERHE